MKFIILILLAFTLLSCGKASSSPSDTNTLSMSNLIKPVIINEHRHSSLPGDWINEYYRIMTNLKTLLPLYQIYYLSIDIYAWNDKVPAPYPGIEGGLTLLSRTTIKTKSYL